MLPTGSGMGVMCGMTRGIKMARPTSSSIMNSTTGLLTSSTPTPAQGNSMLRSREAMHMIRFAFQFQLPFFSNLPKSLQPNKEQQEALHPCSARYLPGPNDMSVLDIAYTIYTKFEESRSVMPSIYKVFTSYLDRSYIGNRIQLWIFQV
ncbi:unnamed protein product [Lactuca saligna]|uniref:Uncharacterized protein n=1 Tax=Lactuca saligna TaxID=75948 RepID=A0AA35YMW5_LACSI|nr:unnamed protein product [Lactuca saligna]